MKTKFAFILFRFIYFSVDIESPEGIDWDFTSVLEALENVVRKNLLGNFSMNFELKLLKNFEEMFPKKIS
jgi:hypothetical protein